MKGINVTRVIVGGIVAGLVLNVSEFVLNTFVLGADMNAAMARMGLPPIGGLAMAVFTVMGFVVGIVLAWLYAAIRPRFGAGPRTALLGGVAVWFLAYVYGSVGMIVMGMFPARAMAIGLVWGLAEILIASLAAGALYRE